VNSARAKGSGEDCDCYEAVTVTANRADRETVTVSRVRITVGVRRSVTVQ